MNISHTVFAKYAYEALATYINTMIDLEGPMTPETMKTTLREFEETCPKEYAAVCETGLVHICGQIVLPTPTDYLGSVVHDLVTSHRTVYEMPMLS